MKTLTLSDERKCYLPLEEALCFEQETLTFRAAIWKVSHSRNLYKFSLYCPQKDHPSLDLWLSQCLTWLMFIWGKIAILRIIGRASHLSYQSWSLPPSIPDICFYMLSRGIKERTKKMGKEEDGAFTVHCVYIQKFSKIFEDCWAWYSVGAPNTTCPCRLRLLLFFFFLILENEKRKSSVRNLLILIFLGSCCETVNFWEALKFISYRPFKLQFHCM